LTARAVSRLFAPAVFMGGLQRARGRHIPAAARAPPLDGVFTESEDGTLRFRSLPPPTDEEVGAVLTTISVRV
jgi:hypothetical protein